MIDSRIPPSLWPDNETTVDLLGFDNLVDELVAIVQSPALLPLTVGVFGDWGSGKSSLMQMAAKRLRDSAAPDGSLLCLEFNGWLFESYDDARAALMSTVLDGVAARLRTIEKYRGLTRRLVRRVNWFRFLGMAARGAASAGLAVATHNPALLAGSVPAAEELAQAFAIDRPDEDAASFRHTIAGFRSDFEELLASAGLECVAVFIDDLDRCLPQSIIETLEAVRLFLSVPKTAFVIGADERLIEQAVAQRYTPDQVGQGVSRQYLEKLVQMPIRIPPMSFSETETYIALLFAQHALKDDELEKLRVAAAENSRRPELSVSMNYGIARSVLGTVPDDLGRLLVLAGVLGPVLGRGLEGNPRQTKRFLNTLMFRRRLAARRQIDLDPQVLAKVMILEYCHPARFRELFQWQARALGKPPELLWLEGAIAVPDKEKEVPSHARSWLGDTSAEEWLRLDPRLSDVDLGPYFHFCRERVAGRAPVAGLLSQEGQQVLNSILGPSRMARQRGLHRFPELVESDKTGIVEAMRQRIRTVPEKTDDINLLIDLAGADPAQVPTLVQTLVELPHSSVPTGAPTRLAGLTGTAPQFASQIESLLQDWEGSQDKRLSTAARRRGQPRKSS